MMTYSSDWDDLWDYLEKIGKYRVEDVELPEWEPPDTGIEPLTGRHSGAYDGAMTDTSTEDFVPTPMLGSKDERVLWGYMNYPGKPIMPNPTEPMGPDVMGQQMYPMTFDYDETTDRTRVGFTTSVPDWEKIMGPAPRE